MTTQISWPVTTSMELRQKMCHSSQPKANFVEQSDSITGEVNKFLRKKHSHNR